jgi:hypothetical protein
MSYTDRQSVPHAPVKAEDVTGGRVARPKGSYISQTKILTYLYTFICLTSRKAI